MQIRTIFLSLLCLAAVYGLKAQEQEELVGANCTSIMVGCKASADGSVITSHTCDSKYRTWVTMEPAADHEEGTMHKVYKGTMHTSRPGSMENVTLAGEIPEAPHTYAYMNTAYPCMNEKQLAMGESTFSGPDTLVNEKGMFLIEELQRIALQRCDNARDAIRLIGQLIKEYGYGDGGECITIADKKEVWQMEILGEGPDKIGGIWAAQRVPDDEVAVSCNVARIGKLDRKNKNYFLCSDNIEEVAKKYGLWDGQGDFIWWKAFPSSYSGNKNFKEREWYIFSQLAPSRHFDLNADELPFSIKPDQKVDVRTVMELFRANYEGSPELDQIQNLLYERKRRDKDGNIVIDTTVCPVANPWMGGAERAMFNMLKPGAVTFYRGVAMSWCSYSTIIQCREWLPDEVGGLCWFSFENPGQSPRIPVFAGQTKMPAGFDLCGHFGYNENAALWHYRKANKLSQIQWGNTKELMLKNIKRYEDRGFEEVPGIESKVQNLLKEDKKKEAQTVMNQYCADFAASTRQTWNEMEKQFWERFWTGF